MKLDRRVLEEELVWKRRNYEQAVERVTSMLEHVLNVDIPQALRWEEYYEQDRIGSTRGADDVAADLTHLVNQAVNNMGFKNLIVSAADVARTEYALVALAKMRETLPPTLVAELEAHENRGRDARIAKRDSEQADRDKKSREQCTGQSGRGRAGVSQCLRKGSILGPDGKRYCKQHAEQAARRSGEPSLNAWLGSES